MGSSSSQYRMLSLSMNILKFEMLPDLGRYTGKFSALLFFLVCCILDLQKDLLVNPLNIRGSWVNCATVSAEKEWTEEGSLHGEPP